MCVCGDEGVQIAAMCERGARCSRFGSRQNRQVDCFGTHGQLENCYLRAKKKEIIHSVQRFEIY